MNGLYALTLIFCVYAAGDFIASKTKAVISMMLVAFLFFMIAFWNGLPVTVFEDSSLQAVANVGVGLLLVNMGTTIMLKDLVREWKTVVLVICSSLGICAGSFLLSGLFMDKSYVMAGTPVLGGGIVAFLIIVDVLPEAASSGTIVFATLILVLHSLIGLPLTSALCRKEAKRLKVECQSREILSSAVAGTSAEKKKIGQIFQGFDSPNYVLAKTALVACAASILSDLTGGKVNMLIICLVLGVIAYEVGFLEKGPLDISKSSTLILAAAMVNAFSSLTQVTPAVLLSMIKPVVIILAIGVASCGIVAVIAGKFLKISWYMSFALGMSAMIGFPATLLVSTEVSKAIAQTPEEEEYLSQNITPKMIIAGMVSVSIVSVIVASVVAGMM